MSDENNLMAQNRIKGHRRFNILAFDGGGVRGTLQAVITSRILDANPNFLRDTDFIAGTSTGAIQALGLAAGRAPHQIEEMYTLLMERVFADRLLDDIRDLWRAYGADYDNKNLRGILREQFGDMRLGELDKRVAITAFALDSGPNSDHRSWKLKVFHNFPGQDSDDDALVVDVALRSSAAPVYFPTYQGYIDGGVVANNPAMVAVAQALDGRSASVPLENIQLLSLGTGRSCRWVEGENHDWGAAQWAPYILFISPEGSVEMTDFQCRQILGDRYFRLNPILTDKVPLDGWERVPELVQIAREEDLVPMNRWIEEKWC